MTINEWYFINEQNKIMAELTKIATFLATQQEKLKDEVATREELFSDKSESYQESDKGNEYEMKTEALNNKKRKNDTTKNNKTTGRKD